MTKLAQISSPSAPSNPAAAGPVQKQRLNVYTMMLILSFMAITTACVLLWMELWQYNTAKDAWIERWWDVQSAKPAGSTTWLNEGVRRFFDLA